MNRRTAIKLAAVGAAALSAWPGALRSAWADPPSALSPPRMDRHIKDYLLRMHTPDQPHAGDLRLGGAELLVLAAVAARLERLQRLVGHGNFALLRFDAARRFARMYPRVGAFEPAEEAFLEGLFYEDASRYGFMGKKPLERLTDGARKRDVIKASGTGNYLFKDGSLEKYERVRREVGEELVLTSGVRGVMKQFLLFLNKALRSEGNLSLASRSLAPPGYSFHGVGDFDVGQVGLGGANFTEAFTETPVFKRLEELGYVRLRYPRDNFLGVRFEPWHIKVV